MSRRLLLAALAALSDGVLGGQSTPAAPQFEVASVKASQSTGRSQADTSPAARLTIDGSLGYVLKWAYDLKNDQFSGPEWLDTTRYQIAAKVPGPADLKDLKVMLQGLLAERFRLAFHRESKELMVYALVVWKDGPKFKDSEGGGDSAVRTSPEAGRRHIAPNVHGAICRYPERQLSRPHRGFDGAEGTV